MIVMVQGMKGNCLEGRGCEQRLSHKSIVHRSQGRDQGGQEDRGKAGGGQRTE